MYCAPLKLGSKLGEVDKGVEIGLSLKELSSDKYLASEVDPSCSPGIHSVVETVALCKMGIHSLVEPVAPCKMGIHSLVEPVAPCKMGIDSLDEPVAPCAMGMDPSVCCFEKGHFWKGPCVVGGGDWSPDFETQSGKEERLDRPAKVSRSESSMPRRVLIVFSGPFNRPDGLASELTKLGYEVVEVDNLEGGEAHDIRRPAAFRAMLDGVQAGRYCAVFLGVSRRHLRPAPGTATPSSRTGPRCCARPAHAPSQPLSRWPDSHTRTGDLRRYLATARVSLLSPPCRWKRS